MTDLPPRTSRNYRYIYEIADHDAKRVYVGLTCNPKSRRWRHENDPRMNDAFGSINFKIICGPMLVEEAAKSEGEFLQFYINMGYVSENRKKTGGIGATTSKWTFELCFKEAQRYTTRTYFQKGSPAAYRACVRNGWLEQVCAHMIPHPRKIKITFEYCESKAKEYQTRGDFAVGEGRSAYYTALRRGWLDAICQHMRQPKAPDGTLTKEHCAKIAKNHLTKTDFRNHNVSEYSTAHRNGWIEEICAHMVPLVKRGPPWCYERTKAEAMKHSRRTDFYKANNPAYNAARRNGWLDEFFPK